MVSLTLTRIALSASYNNKKINEVNCCIDRFDNVIKQLVHASAVRAWRY